ncbi:hypothetical protein K438DRAFT_1853827 [Mycena galopus ATCC 62051]|nr:hypothetical protein K438DRAFT_1853827 [Mycena galopus ATCC 62051]
MSFIENASHFSLGDGVYTNVHGNIYNFYSTTPLKALEDESQLSRLTQRVEKACRLNDDGLEIIPSKDLKLIREIGSGPGYFLHAGQNKGHAVIVKVLNSGPSPAIRRQLESTVALSKRIMHPNILQLQGVSCRDSLLQFIVYESGELFKVPVWWRDGGISSSLAECRRSTCGGSEA